MNRSQYYEQLKSLARQVRTEHGLDSPRVLRSDMRRIYKFYEITIDLWPHRLKNLRGAIINDGLGASVMLDKRLPDDPLIFTMGHELKHFLTDKQLTLTYCHTKNVNEPIEIGAEIFAAELIFPEADFISWMEEHGIGMGDCTAEVIVRLKHETKTTLSYQGLVKRAYFHQFAAPGVLDGIQFAKLEERVFGTPIYKQDWFKARRARKKVSKKQT
ncbi:MAG: hypothetical protein QOD75_2047 [Blastocatellia bacterium]|nr:hypothetical protein [Blastocatellia bacterium]